ncbi:MAG TPA: efflux RND transporter permease subunit [Bacteroidales bacterium]|nr:efflux RND transporter permease subunit [Bacteroidales bacterium]
MPEHRYYRIFHKPILFVLLMALLVGLYSYHRMQTSLFPDVVFPKITVIADNGEQPVDKMMITVTKPLEIAIKRVNGIKMVRSSTNRGSCTIEAFFTWNIDIQLTKTQLESRIAEIKNQLPSTVNIVVEAMGQNIYPVIGYTVESNTSGQVELKKNALYMVRPQFSMVPGVSNVIVRGGRTKEFVIAPHSQMMIALGITPQQIMTSLGNTNFVESNGLLSDYHRLYLSLTDSRIKTLEELKKVVVRNDGHRVILLSDIAAIDIQEQQEFIRINANGHDAVIIDLVKQKGVNLIDFAENVKQKAKEIQQQLPQGVYLKPYYDQSVFVSNSIDSVLECIYIGLILAILVVILFLRSFRASMSVILIIPVTLALTFLVLYLFGITLNIMSLGAIAASIGLIIDDAIVVIEQIHRIHEEQPDKDKHAVVKEAIHGIFPAMVGSSLSTIVIFFPFVLMSGVAGSFFKELSLTMEITLVCSFLSTWLGLPALHLLFGYKPHRKFSFLARKAVSEDKSRSYWLIWFFDKPVFAIVFVLVLVISSVFLINQLKTGFLPVLDEGTIVLDYLSPPGTSLDASDAILREVDTVVMKHPDVSTYMRRTGINMASSISMASGVIPPNEGDYLIQLKKGTRKTTEKVISELRQQVASREPALNIEFGQRIADLLGDLIGRPQPVEIKIFGDDLSQLRLLAYKTKTLLSKIPGIADVQSGIIVDGPTITIIPDPSKLAQFNLSPADFQTQIKACNEGVEVGQVQEGEQMIRILMRFINVKENNLARIKKQLIFAPDGISRPLEYFAYVELSAGDPDITREDLKSNVVVTARLENRDLGSAISEIKAVIGKNLPLPSGAYIVFSGTYAEQQSSFRELLMILISAILLVFAVMLFLFRKLKITFLVIFISIIGIGGSIWALFLSGIQLNVASYTGIIMIVGIIAENAIFTVNQFLTTLKITGNVDLSIGYAISLRIRPNLMTAIGAILALSPLALGLGIGAQMQQPLAIAVIGGFIVAIPLLLFVFPTFLRLLYKKSLKNIIISD